jgi:Sulfotransferase family
VHLRFHWHRIAIQHRYREHHHDGPVFLVGAQRSGTTVLAIALSHAFAAAGGRFTVNGKLPYLLRRWWTQEDLEHQHLRADEVVHGLRRVPIAGVGASAWFDRTSVALRASAARAATLSASNTVEEEVRLVCGEAYGAVPWGDKYNEYLLDLPWLHRVFPAARWIFIVREPADAIASMLGWRREKAWNPRDARAAAAKWTAWNQRWLDFRDSLELERAFEVGYEQLAGDGGRRLSDWLGLDLETHLSEFEVRRCRVRPELTPEALGVRRSLMRLGLLGDDRGAVPDSSSMPLGS